ncbi:MAG: thioredoxin domain-containing protein [Acidobacteriota bacterium]
MPTDQRTASWLTLGLFVVQTALLGLVVLRLRGVERELAGLRQSLAAGALRAGSAPIAIEPGDGPSKGPADAPVTIVEFSDFTCHSCSQLQPALKDALAARPAQARLVFRYFPLAPEGKPFDLARAAECARAQEKFWPAHDLLFSEATELTNLAAAVDRLATLGLDRAVLETCLAGPESGERVRREAEVGRGYGVDATPTLFFNGHRLEGAVSAEELIHAIDQAVPAPAGAKPAGS